MRAGPPSETLSCNLDLTLTGVSAELELQELEELHGRSFSVISSGDSDADSCADTVSSRARTEHAEELWR